MSTTPRTDAECIQIYNEDVTGCSDARDYVDASFARHLETELATAKAEAAHYMSVAQKATDELVRLRADNLTAHEMACAAGLERDRLRAELADEKNLHTQTRTVVEELNTICTDLRNAGGPPFIRSEAIRLLREDQVTLRAEVERLTKQIKDDNRAYGCELRDPNGTIWEQAAKDHARAERAEAECLEQARLLGKSGEREADLLGKIDRLNRVIERASVQFFHDGTDGETAAKMLTVLNEAK